MSSFWCFGLNELMGTGLWVSWEAFIRVFATVVAIVQISGTLGETLHDGDITRKNRNVYQSVYKDNAYFAFN